jgi:hypothetical protein
MSLHTEIIKNPEKSKKNEINHPYYEDILLATLWTNEQLKNLENKLNSFLNENVILKNLQDLHNDIKNTFLELCKIIFTGEKNSLSDKEIKELKKFLPYIHKKSLETAKNLTKNLLLFKNYNIKILESEIFDWTILEISQKNKKEILKWFYLLSYYYLIKYVRRLQEVDKIITLKFKKNPEELIHSSQIASDIYNYKLKNLKWIFIWTEMEKKEKIQIMELLILITNNFSIKIWEKLINFFNNIAENARIKTLESVIKKILKDPKYRKQISEELLVLSDQIWFKKEFLQKEDAKTRAILIKQNIPSELKYKENDRGIIEENHSNKDTNLNKPFINFSFVEKDNPKIPLWEISIRLTDDFSDVIGKLSWRKDYQITNWKVKIINVKSFTRLAIEKIERINHHIYKTSQDIRIIRKLLVDWKILWVNWDWKPKIKQNFVKEFLQKRFEEFLNNFFKIIEKNNILIEKNENNLNQIKLSYYQKLLELTEKAIIDIAWEPFKDKFNELNIYNAIPEKSLERKLFKKYISNLFTTRLLEKKKRITREKMKKNLRKISKKLNIPKIPLSLFDKDVKTLTKLYKSFYEEYYWNNQKRWILNTAIFKPEIEKIISKLNNKI